MRIWNALVALVYNAINNGFYNGFFSLISFLYQWGLGSASAFFVDALDVANLAGTYANGTAGVGATLTKSSAGAFPTIDGVTAQLGNVYLLTAQTTGLQNGLYSLTRLGSSTVAWQLTRYAGQGPGSTNPWNVSASMVQGSLFLVRNGTTYGGAVWAYTGASSPTVGTTALSFAADSLKRTATGSGPVFSWQDVRLASTANVNIASAPASLDGVALVAGDRVLLKNQSSGLENGIRIFTAAAAALARSADATATSDFVEGKVVRVTAGTQAGQVFEFVSPSGFVLDTNSAIFELVTNLMFTDETQTVTAATSFAQTMLRVWNAAKSFAAQFTFAGTQNTVVTVPDVAALTIAQAAVQTGAPSATSAPAFTGTAPGSLVATSGNAIVAAFSGTGQSSAGQVITTTDNQTMALNQCAGMLFISATHGPYLIASNTAVTGAQAVLTIYGTAPTTDAGTYKIISGPTPVGTVAAVPTATHTHAQT